MKNNYKELETLSAYVDNELSAEEASRVEEKILSSKRLQDKLAELNKLKNLTTSSIKKPEDNPYFETRLNAALSFNKPINKIKNWYPVIGFAAIAILLMIVLKFNPTLVEDLLEQQKTNLSGFYAENLKPLLFTAGLTNEDIFNFAFSKKLPLDKSNNKYLLLGSKTNGDNYFEIKTSGFAPDDYSFEKFVKTLNLNKNQKHQMDSILDSYADDLQSQVLVNNKNTVAINPNLWNYHKAIFADIMAFAKDANNSEFNKIVPAGYTFYNRPEVGNFVHKIKTNSDSQYIFITPDSVFTSIFKFDKGKFKVEMEQFRKDLDKNMKNMKEQLKGFQFNITIDSNLAKLKNQDQFNKNFKIFVDSNVCRVEIGNVPIPKIELPDFDSIAAQIDEAAKNFKGFSFSIPNFDGNGNFKFRYKSGDSSKNFEFNMPNIDSIIHMNLNRNLFGMPGNDGDSTTAFKFFMNDTSLINQKEFHKEMEMLQKELEKMREEMKNLRKDINKDSKKSKSVEI
jgi:hypothetical protein